MSDRKYTIIINEAQRQYLITALTQCQLQGHFGADSEGREEIDLLQGMLDDLDKLEDRFNTGQTTWMGVFSGNVELVHDFTN